MSWCTVTFGDLLLFHRHSPRKPASLACDDQQGALLYPAGLATKLTQLHRRRRVWKRNEWTGVARENNSPCYSNSGVNQAHANMTPNMPEYLPHNTLEWVPGDFIFKIQYIYNINWIYKNWINENLIYIYKPNKLLNIYLININWINIYVYKLNTYQIHILNKYIST